MSVTSQDNWKNIEEAAGYMGVTKDTVRNWIKKLIFLHIRLESFGNLRDQSWMNG